MCQIPDKEYILFASKHGHDEWAHYARIRVKKNGKIEKLIRIEYPLAEDMVEYFDEYVKRWGYDYKHTAGEAMCGFNNWKSPIIRGLEQVRELFGIIPLTIRSIVWLEEEEGYHSVNMQVQSDYEFNEQEWIELAREDLKQYKAKNGTRTRH